MSIQTKNLILKIDNYKFLASNAELTQNEPEAFLSIDAVATATTLTVNNTNGFADTNYVLIEYFGNQKAEIRKISGTPTATVITLSAGVSFDHFGGCKVTRIPYNQIEFSRSVTATGTKTVLGTVTAVNPNLEATFYQDSTNTTGFGFFRFKNETSGAFSDYCGAIPYAGNYDDSVEMLIQKALDKTGGDFNKEFLNKRQAISDVNEFLTMISQRTDWTFEIATNSSTNVSTNDIDFDISSLYLKYNYSNQGIFSVLFGTKPLIYKSIDEMETIFQDKPNTTLTVATAAGDTSVTVTNSYEFSDSGTIYIGSDAIIYTANDTTTGVLSGIPTTGTGSITAINAIGSQVWQDIAPGEPNYYTILNDTIRLDVPVESNLSGYTLKFRYLKKLDVLTGFSERVTVPFYNVIPLYIAHKIEMRRKNTELADKYYAMAANGIEQAVNLYQLPLQEEYSYYSFGSIGSTL